MLLITGVAPLRGFVYALGGHDGLSIFDSVERLKNTLFPSK